MLNMRYLLPTGNVALCAALGRTVGTTVAVAGMASSDATEDTTMDEMRVAYSGYMWAIVHGEYGFAVAFYGLTSHAQEALKLWGKAYDMKFVNMATMKFTA